MFYCTVEVKSVPPPFLPKSVEMSYITDGLNLHVTQISDWIGLEDWIVIDKASHTIFKCSSFATNKQTHIQYGCNKS